jgi:2,3,4,5-tetrahydropyridine-2-carboxylate N-succinyltransferase
MSSGAYALGLGTGTHDRNGNWLEVFYPAPLLAPEPALAALVRETMAAMPPSAAQPDATALAALAGELCGAGYTAQAAVATQLAASARPVALTLLETDSAPADVPAAYLKLQLISHRLVRPHGTCLDGLFAVLPNVAWTSAGAIAIDELAERQFEARLRGEVLSVHSVDKFPRLSDYVVPQGVRIADTARVRLGAWLGAGTTVMHEGFINFNAGVEGPGMIEGRVSAGVMVGAHSDLGGGCSTMGTLSGGGNIVISVGEHCLIGANAGIGIPLGDHCTVEAGLYVTAGTKVTLLDRDGMPAETVKARELAGQSELLFRRNSTTGAVECQTRRSAVELNSVLHAHN